MGYCSAEASQRPLAAPPHRTISDTTSIAFHDLALGCVRAVRHLITLLPCMDLATLPGATIRLRCPRWGWLVDYRDAFPLHKDPYTFSLCEGPQCSETPISCEAHWRSRRSCRQDLRAQLALRLSPEGPSTQIIRFLGPKIHSFWTLKPYYLGTWTLRVGLGNTQKLIETSEAKSCKVVKLMG